MEEYNKIIYLSDEAKEEMSKMSEFELEMISIRIAQAMREAEIKIREELNGQK